ncbi:MAG: peptide chain release factor N(5)-glutamine methyltransferase [Candidatus Stygibacter frigidus]|nr:peptide chain release factor N(5)-glutamine methyltransferase [Candidatus Stygibacter frigidus]
MKVRLFATEIYPLLKEIIQLLTTFSVDSPQAEAEQIVSHFYNLNRTQIFQNPDLHVTWKIRLMIEKMLRTRSNHCPLQYLLGQVEFYNSNIKVTQDVLIPRPETELLVDIILQENKEKHLRVCDLGTGSGAIAIALKKARPDWQVIATDISAAALKIARENALINDCLIDFIQSDIFSDIKTKFDLIVSNPPYISKFDYDILKPELFYEPLIALTAPEDGLYFYKKIINSASKYLSLPATLYLEIGAEQSSKISKLADQAKAQKIIIKKDYNNFDRFMIIYFA